MAEASVRGLVGLLDPPAEPGIRSDLASILAGHGVDLVDLTDLPRGPGILALIVGPDTQVGAEDLRHLPDLLVVAATSTGVDHIAAPAASDCGVWVTNVTDYCTEEVADHALALTLDLLRGVTRADRSLRAGEWTASGTRHRVAGARLGLVGFGRTAKALARRAIALEMSVSAFAPRGPEGEPAAPTVPRFPALLDLLAWSDVVSLHLPLAAATRGLVDADALAVMRPGSFLVNVARGGLVDQGALADAVRSGHLAGAALDVMEVEPLPRHDPVLGPPTIVLTPHVAWESAAARALVFRRVGDQVAAVLGGREPVDAVARPRRLPRQGEAGP